MKKYFAIFSLYAEHALEYKMRSFVWFFVIFMDAMVYLLFWRGALSGPSTSGVWTFSEAVSYYLLLLITGSFLQIHIEEEVAFEDIQYGRLSQYLLRPFSYLKFKFFQELPWRIIQGSFGLLTFVGIAVFVRRPELIGDMMAIPIMIGIVVSAYLLCFIYKMIVGTLAFWTIDFSGLQNIQTIIFLLFSGMLVPLHLLPDSIRSFALSQPVAFTLYYPVRAIQGALTTRELWRVLGFQWLWLVLLYLTYRWIWKKGMKEFTAVGQ